MIGDNVLISSKYFVDLYKYAVEGKKSSDDWVSVVKERDELKAKLSTAQNYEAVIAAKERAIAAVKEERNRLNAKVNELMKKLEAEQSTNANIGIVYAMSWKDKLAAAERCIEDIEFALLTHHHNDINCVNRCLSDAQNVIRAYREKKEAR